MSGVRFKQARLRVPKSRKRQVCTQFGALCWRLRDHKLQILLVTSRGRGRWIIPKGWPMDGETPANAAATEAWEEAGVEGKPSGNCLGVYSYSKITEEDEDDLACVVAVFPIEVKRLKDSYPERKDRRRKWVSARKAAKLVEEEELAQIIRLFTPRVAERRIAGN